MSKTKATKIDKEIQEGLYDPKSEVKKARKPSAWLQFVKAHSNMRTAKGLLDLKAISKLWKEQGKAKTYDIKGIADSLRRHGIEADLVDIEAEYDHSLSHSENLKHIKKMLGIGGRRGYRDYARMQDDFYKGYGKLINASPQERAAAFARMREMGTLRGYDKAPFKTAKAAKKADDEFRRKYLEHLRLKSDSQLRHTQYRGYDPKVPTTYVIRDKNGNKRKATYAEWLKWMKEQKKLYDPKLSALPPARWYEAMVKGIKKSSDVRNPYAIVKSIWAKLSPSKQAEIKAREAKGERFKYDLPLPVDKPTRGIGTVRMVKPFKLAEVQVNMSVKDYLMARASGLFQKMKRQDGTTALVARCKSPEKNVNIFVDKAGR